MFRRARFSLLSLLTIWSAASPVLAQGPGAVSIVLRHETVVDDSLITLEQVAMISGGSESLRKRLAKLDVAEFNLGAAQTSVWSEQVRFRLLVAGMEPAQFHVGGAKHASIVESEAPVTLRKILTAAELALRGCYPGDASQVSITANRGVYMPVLELRPGERVRLEAKMKRPAPPTGRAMVEVALLVNGKTREVVPVAFEISEVAIAPLPLVKEKSSIRAALYTTPARESRSFLIKSRDSVKIVANIGAARLEALGEALQDGNVGDVIRVRNVESSRIVHGRVDASGIVLVEY